MLLLPWLFGGEVLTGGDEGVNSNLEGRDPSLPSLPVFVEQRLQEVDKLKPVLLLSCGFELVHRLFSQS